MSMNKARITYRFDPNRPRSEGGHPSHMDDTGKVIPLYQEEYQVVEERMEQPEPREQRDSRETAETFDYRKPKEAGHDGPWRQQERDQARDQVRGRKDELNIRDYQGLNQYTTDYGAWSSPFDAETKRIEELIRQSNEREGRRPVEQEPPVGFGPPAFQERPLPDYRERGPDREWEHDREHDRDRNREEYYNGQTGYFQPGAGYRDEGEERWSGPIVHGPRYVRHSRPPWLKIGASIAGAAVTGVLLGFFALSMFSDADSIADIGKTPAADTPATQDAKPVTAHAQNADANASAGGAGAGTAISGKQLAMAYAGSTYSVLQHGTFAGQQGADQAKGELVKKGLAAATEQSDKYYVFAGVATDKDSATFLGQQLKDNSSVDIYVKAYTIPSVTKVVWNGSSGDTLKSYLEQSDKLIQSINKLTVMNLDGEAPTAIDPANMQSISNAHTAWSQLSNKVSQEAGQETKALVQRMNNAMNSAKASLDEYNKNPSTAMLWQAQTYTLQFIIAEKELLGLIGS